MQAARVCALLLAAVACAHGYPNLLFTTSKDIRLANVSARSSSSRVSFIVKDLQEGAAVDYHYAKGLVCWTDHGLEMIQCINYNGTTNSATNRVAIVTSGLVSPDGLAIDWLTHKIYWIDTETNRIEVATLNGQYRKVLFWEDIDQPRAIALVPQESLMFWTDWGEVPKIERAGMNGDHSTRTVIVKENIFWPNGLTVDFSTRTLYWLDGRLKFIESMDFTGHKRKRILDKGVLYPYALSLFKNVLYWTDWKTWSIHVFDKSAGNGPKEMIHGENVPMDIKVWDPARQPLSPTPCDNNNAGCSHLCLLSPAAPGYTCGCPTGVRLMNNHTCYDDVHEILLLVQLTEIAQISLDTPDYSSITLPLKGLKHPIAIDFDPVEKFLYWTDDDARGIRRARLDGSGQQDVVISEVEQPDGIAIDAVGRNIYWTDTGTDRIEVARLDGSYRTALITEHLVEPRAIVVAPEKGLMFWSDWNEKAPKIERAAMDGSQRVIIVTEQLGWPNGLAMDHERSLLYWCDAKTDKIEVVNFDGSDRMAVVSEKLPHAFGLSLLGDFIYWTDWQRRSIDRVNRFTRQSGSRQTLADQMPNVMGLKAVRLSDPIPTSPCSKDNGGCSQLCLNRPNNDYVCTCQIGQELSSDGRTCVVPEAFILFARKENIGHISIENANTSSVIPISGIKDVSALDYNLQDNFMYWTDVKLKSISRAFLNGSEVEHVIEIGLDSPEGMVVDWIANNIYWADTGSKRIEVARLNGKSRKVLIWQDIDEPRSLALDPQEGYMYWTEWGGAGSLERAALDGSLRSTLINRLGRASGLTIDLTGRRMYWTELHGAQAAIESSDLDGKNRRVLVSRDTGRPYAITQYQDYIYWTDWDSGVIERADKATGLNRTTIYQHLDHVTDMVVYHRSYQTGTNACSSNNGNCSHLCLALPAASPSSSVDLDTVPHVSSTGHYTYTHRCGCPTHYTLAFDGTTCHAPESFLLFSQKNALTRLIPSGEDCPDVILPIQGVKQVKAVEYDPLTQFVYWIDNRQEVIRRSRDNGSESSVFVGSRADGPEQYPNDLALDPISHLLFWTCADTNAINVTRLDNTSSQPLGAVVRGEGLKPRLLAIHSIRSLLFWSDVGGSMARVMMARYDGKNQTVVADNIESVTALTVDQGEKGERVYWAQPRVIESAALDGSDRKTLISSGLMQVSHIAVFGNYLYFVDNDHQTLTRVHKITGENAFHVQAPKLPSLTDLVSVSVPSPQLISHHPCGPGQGHGACSHLCMPSETGRVCGCPIGMSLAEDGKTCVDCGINHFTCASGNKDCIPASWRCDGQPDCSDSSDEINCPQCGPEFVACRSGSTRCIEKERRCDSIKDCMDGSDELSCQDPSNVINVIGPNTQPGEIASFAADSNSYLTLLCFVGLAIVFTFVFGLIGARKCRKSVAHGDDGLDPADPAHDPLSPQGAGALSALGCGAGSGTGTGPRGVASGRAANGTRSISLSTGGHGHGHGHGAHHGTLGLKGQHLQAQAVRMSAMNSGSTSGSPSYHRSHITGASSSSASGGANNAALLSSSSLLCYPRETLNPPPSPATTSDSTRRAESRLYRPYRHYRAMNQPPPPTPCSTDVCDESDYRYDSDPFPPPPTPAPSCPPSPSSRSSTYFNPLPPPPSPSPTGRCDC